METKQWTTADKSAWPQGPWNNEPDKMQWTDATTGLPCLIHRNGAGALCGYVGVAEGHPYFGKDYNDVPHHDVHGGLTFSDFCAETLDESHGICHVAGPGEPDRVWWLGFDCSHHFDYAPGSTYRHLFDSSDEHYRDVPFVQQECQRLAQQLVEG